MDSFSWSSFFLPRPDARELSRKKKKKINDYICYPSLHKISELSCQPLHNQRFLSVRVTDSFSCARRETELLYVSSLSSTRARFLFLSRWNNYGVFFLVIQIKFSFPRLKLTNTCSFYLSRIKNQLRRAPSLPLRPRRETVAAKSFGFSRASSTSSGGYLGFYFSKFFVLFLLFISVFSKSALPPSSLRKCWCSNSLSLSLSLSYFIK